MAKAEAVPEEDIRNARFGMIAACAPGTGESRNRCAECAGHLDRIFRWHHVDECDDDDLVIHAAKLQVSYDIECCLNPGVIEISAIDQLDGGVPGLWNPRSERGQGA